MTWLKVEVVLLKVRVVPKQRLMGSLSKAQSVRGGRCYIHERKKNRPAALHSRPDFDVIRSLDVNSVPKSERSEEISLF
jgi:hypothetical protein